LYIYHRVSGTKGVSIETTEIPLTSPLQMVGLTTQTVASLMHTPMESKKAKGAPFAGFRGNRNQFAILG
jgi:hypothetical protein